MEACLRACLGLGIIRLVQSYGQERLCFDRHNLPAQDELVSETSDVGGGAQQVSPSLRKTRRPAVADVEIPTAAISMRQA
jgi:hypothetical protein